MQTHEAFFPPILTNLLKNQSLHRMHINKQLLYFMVKMSILQPLLLAFPPKTLFCCLLGQSIIDIHSLTHSFLLAAKPGILSVHPGNEGHLLSHFHLVYALAALKVQPPSLLAGLLEVSSAAHCFSDPISRQDPGECKRKYVYCFKKHRTCRRVFWIIFCIISTF